MVEERKADLMGKEDGGAVEVAPIRPSPRVLLQGLASGGLLLLFTMLMLVRVEPFASWYYAFAWWTFIGLMDAVVLWRRGDSLFWRDHRGFLFLALLSVPAWLVFEGFNLFIRNWYYVGASPSWPLRWMGYAICFSTVLPAIFEAMELLGATGIVGDLRLKPLGISRRLLAGMVAMGIVSCLLPILFPRYCFPLVWLALFFLLDPINYLLGEESLLGQWERGEWSTTSRLLLGGLLCGLAWELFNAEALCKWIYTVPFFEEGKLFEMPLPGFLGFLPFALECFAIWNFAKAVARRTTSKAKGIGLVLCLVAASLAMFHLVDKNTVGSFKPYVKDLEELAPYEARLLEQAGIKRLDIWLLKPGARARESLVLELLGATPEMIAKWRTWAALVTLKGIGTENLKLLLRAGVTSLRDLAQQEPESLFRKLQELQRGAPSPREEQVRLWVKEARKVCKEEPGRGLPGCK